MLLEHAQSLVCQKIPHFWQTRLRAKWRLEMRELREQEMRGRGGDHLFKHHKKGGGWGWPQGGFPSMESKNIYRKCSEFLDHPVMVLKCKVCHRKGEAGGRWSNRCHDWNPLPLFLSSSSLHLSQSPFHSPFLVCWLWKKGVISHVACNLKANR